MPSRDQVTEAEETGEAMASEPDCRDSGVADAQSRAADP
jgi:hypothetical protein